MNRKFIAFLTALSVVGGVCLPVSAENETEAEVITVYYDNTVDETAPAEEAVQEEAPAEAETAEADTAEDAQDTEETEVSEATEEAPAPVEETETVTETTTATDDLTADEADYLAVSWAEWDASSGTLTLKGQLPNTYWDAPTSTPFDIATLSGVKTTDVRKIVINSGTRAGTSTSQMFRNMTNLVEIVGLSRLDTSSVTDMTGMFVNCSSMTYMYPADLDTSKVTSMSGMFNGCAAVTKLDLSGFDTSRVKDMDHMFNGCNALETIIVSETFRTTSVTSNSSSMFFGCFKLVGGAGSKVENDHLDVTYARIDKGTARKGYFTACVAQPTVEIKPVFGGRTVTFKCADSDAEIYYNFGSSNINTSCRHIKPGESIFLSEPMTGNKAAMYFKAYKNDTWSDLGKWGVLNVKIAAPLIVKSGPASANRYKIYTQTKNSYIIYTTDGSEPSIEEGIQQLQIKNGKIIWGTSGVITVSEGATIKAIADRSGLVTSEVLEYTDD